MRTVSDFIQLIESEAAVNVVSSGDVATREVPIGKVVKRKTLESVGTDPLATAYAPETNGVEIEKGATPEDSDDHKKHMFHLKQQYQNDQVSNL
jgi:hypothetical protein